VLIYCPDGKPKRKDEYQDGKLIKGKCFTCEGKDTAYIIYEGPCDFPGGENKMMAYLMKELVYPQVDKEKGNSGTVYLTFMVEKDGSITDIKILRGVSETIDAEAIRVVKKMPKFIPAMHDGEPIRMQWSMPLKFILQ
jgi:TonB family protein